MFPVSPLLTILIGIFAIAVVAVFCVLFGLLLNWILRTNPKKYLSSSVVVGVFGFVASSLTLFFALPPLNWKNGQALNVRTVLWDYFGLIALILALACVGIWQATVRGRRDTK